MHLESLNRNDLEGDSMTEACHPGNLSLDREGGGEEMGLLLPHWGEWSPRAHFDADVCTPDLGLLIPAAAPD